MESKGLSKVEDLPENVQGNRIRTCSDVSTLLGLLRERRNGDKSVFAS